MASTKRKIDSQEAAGSHSNDAKKSRAELERDPRIEYTGFSLQQLSGPFQVPVEDRSISAEVFFDKYISKRIPCVIDALPKLPSGQEPSVSLDLLRRVAGDEMVQVERRYDTSQSFGQNRTRSRQLNMKIAEFVDKMNEADHEHYYLSTQESTGGNEEGPFQAPCRQLLEQKCIGSSIPYAGSLLLDSCNLWVGKSKDGSSSGLHHDYHDNFFLLFQGRKQFRLFSPDIATKSYTYGTIERLHFNGRISYEGSEARADGAPVGSFKTGDAASEDSECDDEEEEVVLGLGFDYKDSDDEDADFDQEGPDDFDKVMGTTNQENGTTDHDEKHMDEAERPDSFSKVDLNATAEERQKQFPLFNECRESVVDLRPGQTLYLPAGWFHEVTSFASSTALNYWYHPPDALDCFSNPYRSDFWSKRIQQGSRN
jgi:hypothetical protein